MYNKKKFTNYSLNNYQKKIINIKILLLLQNYYSYIKTTNDISLKSKKGILSALDFQDVYTSSVQWRNILSKRRVTHSTPTFFIFLYTWTYCTQWQSIGANAHYIYTADIKLYDAQTRRSHFCCYYLIYLLNY